MNLSGYRRVLFLYPDWYAKVPKKMDRILAISSQKALLEELKKIKVTPKGIEAMQDKAQCFVIKLHNIKIGAANIIKQDMLSLGADAAVARGVVNGSIERTDILLFGSTKTLKRLAEKLTEQKDFNLPRIRETILQLIRYHTHPPITSLLARGYKLQLQHTLIMGVLNLTPDSFYDGGKYIATEKALTRIEEMVEEGADIIDIGAESTRPYSKPISAEEECERLLPFLEKVLQNFDIPISVDTYKAKVAREALDAGAHIINDISGLKFDPALASTIAEFPDVPVVLMHIKGTPATMQDNPTYNDLIDDILDSLQDSIDIAKKAGIMEENIIIDPGIGFGKKLEDNLSILHRLSEFHCLGKPILVGCSNKGFIGKILDSPKEERLEGTLAAHGYAVLNGANIIRVHDVKAHKKFITMIDHLKNPEIPICLR